MSKFAMESIHTVNLCKAERLEAEARKIRNAALSGIESLSDRQAAGSYRISSDTLEAYVSATGKRLPTPTRATTASHTPTEQDKQIAATRQAIEANKRTTAIISLCSEYGATGAQAAEYIESMASPDQIESKLKVNQAAAQARAMAAQLKTNR